MKPCPCRLLFPAVALAALLLASCRSGPVVLPLADVVPPGTAHFALDPIPTPREAELSDSVAVMGRVSVREPRGVDALFMLRSVLPPAGEWVTPEQADTLITVVRGGPAAAEAFELTITSRDGRVEVVLGAASPIGRLWAAETLRQLIFEKDGIRYVRLGKISDQPAILLRGSKRPLEWEHRYRANLSWENPGYVNFVPVFSPGGVLDATEAGLKRVWRFFIEGYRLGADRFALEFDDVGFDMTPETRELYGSYFFALTAYLRACRTMLGEIDPDAVLYWLPQTYWTTAKEFQPFAHQVGLAGGAPPDLGLVLTGPEVISTVIPTEEIARARQALGLTTRKAAIYDNLGREGDHGPLTGRAPDLSEEVGAFFGERGEVLNRITRLDYAWNPGAYDPERSHLLACREVVGVAAAPYLHRLVLGIDELSPRAAVDLFEQIEMRTFAHSGGPVERGEYLRHLRGWINKRLNVDSSPESP